VDEFKTSGLRFASSTRYYPAHPAGCQIQKTFSRTRKDGEEYCPALQALTGIGS